MALSRGGDDWDKDSKKYNEKSSESGRTVSGALMSIGFDRPSGATSFGANTQRTSADFVQLGFTDGMRPPIQISQAFASIGYRVLAGIAQSTRLEAGISAKNDRGTYGLKVGGASDVTAVRGSASGGLAFWVATRLLPGKSPTALPWSTCPDSPMCVYLPTTS